MNHSSLHRINEVILENLSNESFGPEQLAAKLGMSHSSLHRKLKEEKNKTISQFIREVRLEKARELLQNEELSVSEIAYRVGFGSPTYFNKCFHEFFGVTPGECRRNPKNSQKFVQKKPAAESIAKKVPAYSYSIPLVILIVTTFILVNDKWMRKDISIEKSIAVLPVQYLGEPEYSYQGRGARLDIINQLSKINDLVVFEADSFFYDQGFTFKQPAGYYLRLAYFNEMQEILIYASLTRVDNKQIIWNERFHRKKEEIFKIYSEVAEAIAKKVGATISPREKYLMNKFSTPNLTAYDYYMQARDLVWQFQDSHDTLLFYKARSLLKKSLELDSGFAPAYAALSSLYITYDYWWNFFKEDVADSALFYADMALKFDDELAEAYYIRGEIFSILDSVELATAEYNKAISLNPGNWRAYFSRSLNKHNFNFSEALKDQYKAFNLCQTKEKLDVLKWIADYYARLGFFEIAEHYLKEALNADGDSLYYFKLVGIYNSWKLKWDSRTEQYLLKALELDTIGNRQVIYRWLSYCHVSRGEYEKALEYFLKFKRIMDSNRPSYVYYMHTLGYLYWLNGNYELATHCFDKQIEFARELIDKRRPFWNIKCCDLAASYAFFNEKELAYKYLNYLCEYEFSVPVWVVNILKFDSLFNSIRPESEFQQIVARVEAKHLAEKEEVKQWLIENDLYDF